MITVIGKKKVQWPQNNSELGCPLQIHAWEGGNDREAVARTGRR